MNIKCPNCGAVHSLDSVLGAEAGGELLLMLAELSPSLAKAALRYLGLFRPAKSQLSFARAAKLLGELMPEIQANECVRDGVRYAAPEAAWINGFEACLKARDEGRLKLPFKSHGYLKEIVSQYQPLGGLVSQSTQPASKPNSKTMGAIAILENLK